MQTVLNITEIYMSVQSVQCKKQIELHCIESIHFYSDSCSAHQSEALLVDKVDRVEGESWFQSAGPMIAKAHI